MKKTTLSTALAALFLACLATPALADNTGKYYVAADFGAASYSNATMPAFGSYTAETFKNPGMFDIVGGYHFSQMWGAEIGYTQFGDSTISYPGTGDLTIGMHSLQVAATGTYPINSQFDLIGKVGLSSNTEKGAGTGSFAGISGSSKTDALLGVGVQYNLNTQSSIRVQYQSFGEIGNGTNHIKASAFSGGWAYTF